MHAYCFLHELSCTIHLIRQLKICQAVYQEYEGIGGLVDRGISSSEIHCNLT